MVVDKDVLKTEQRQRHFKKHKKDKATNEHRDTQKERHCHRRTVKVIGTDIYIKLNTAIKRNLRNKTTISNSNIFIMEG